MIFTDFYVYQVVRNLTKNVYGAPNQVANILDMQEVCDSVSNVTKTKALLFMVLC